MGDWNINGGYALIDNLNSGETGYLKQVDCGAANHTKGNWVEMSSGLLFDTGMLILNVNTTYHESEYLIDLAVGAISSEVVIVPNLLFCLVNSVWWANSTQYNIPLNLPKNTRVIVRQQCYSKATANYLKMSLNYLPVNSFHLPSFQVCEALGADTAGTGGVSVDPGTSANTEGAWSEISAATPRTFRAIQFEIGSTGDLSKTSCYWALDIGVGAAGQEQEIIKDFSIAMWATADQYQPTVSPLFYFVIPQGTRIAARCKCTITTATDRLLDIVMHGYS